MSTDLEIPEEKWNEIQKAISSDESVVGIDAKKTHIIIIHMLREIMDKIEDVEQRLKTLERHQG